MFNYERVHEAIGMQTPSECYKPSEIVHDSKEPEYQYPDAFERRSVCSYGKFNWNGKRLFLTKALAGENIGIEKIASKKLRLWYANFSLGDFDPEFSTLKNVKPMKYRRVIPRQQHRNAAWG